MAPTLMGDWIRLLRVGKFDIATDVIGLPIGPRLDRDLAIRFTDDRVASSA